MTVYLKRQPQFIERVAEWMISVQMAMWGGVLLLPQDTFSTSPAFRILALFVSETTLGSLLVVLGVARIVGLVVNGHRKKVTPWVRLVSAAGGFFVFTGISAAFAMSGTISTWIAIYPVIAAVEIVNIYRSAHDAGQSIAVP